MQLKIQLLRDLSVFSSLFKLNWDIVWKGVRRPIKGF